MKLSVTLPATALGLPLEGVENPYLVVPAGKVKVSVEIKQGCDGLKLSGYDDRGLLAGFWRNVAEGLRVRGCAEVTVNEAPAKAPNSSMYAALTTAIIYGVAREHGEVMDELEIVEMARLSDPWREPWWQGSVDAMRYCSATGKVVAYRNDEESGELAEGHLRVESGGSEVEAAGNPREFLGPTSFDILIHLVGNAVIEAGDEVRDRGISRELALRWARVQSAAAYLAYGVDPPREGCWWAPGVPRRLELVCLAP